MFQWINHFLLKDNSTSVLPRTRIISHGTSRQSRDLNDRLNAGQHPALTGSTVQKASYLKRNGVVCHASAAAR